MTPVHGRAGRAGAAPAATTPRRRGPEPGESARSVYGFTIVEVLVSLVVLGIVLSVAWRVAATQKRVFGRLLERQAVLHAERTVSWVLATEVGSGRREYDRAVVGPDVLGLRAFRGRGIPCVDRVGPEGWIPVRESGWRRPDPAKDSVILVDRDGRRAVVDLAERGTGPSPCGTIPGEEAEWWRLPFAAGLEPVVLRYFERGSYHLEDAAFRYRRGRGGRQPLTEEILDGTRSGLALVDGRLVVRFRPRRRSDLSGGAALAAADTGWVRTFRVP